MTKKQIGARNDSLGSASAVKLYVSLYVVPSPTW